MSKVHIGRQGFLTKNALPNVNKITVTPVNLLLLGSGSNGQTTFTDSSVNNFTINRFGNTVISTATFPTGMTSSILFDGNGDYLTTTPSTAWALGTQNFTLECYFLSPVNVTNTQHIVGSWAGASVNTSFHMGVGSGNVVFAEWSPNGTLVNTYASSATFTINTWNHLAFVRSGNVWTLYLNGVNVFSTTASGSVFSSPSNFTVGGTSLNSQWFNGYLSNVRVEIGTAIYTSNFTPPSLPMSNVVTGLTNDNLYGVIQKYN